MRSPAGHLSGHMEYCIRSELLDAPYEQAGTRMGHIRASLNPNSVLGTAHWLFAAALGSLVAGLVGLSQTTWAAAASAQAIAGPERDVNWSLHGGDSTEQRFSRLAAINEKTIQRLNLAWSLDLPGETALEATPLEIDGVLYFTGSFGDVYAVDARRGALLWKHNTLANEANPRGVRRIYNVNRGVAWLNGRVIVCTRDGRMIALDGRTGKSLWSSSFLLPDGTATSSGAPRVFNGKVIIGTSGSEVKSRGYVTAVDGTTGKVLWRFFTVPGDPSKGFEDATQAMAARTWSGEWWKYGGGGAPWNAITFDSELNQIYFGTGNGGPYAARFRSHGSQDNLFVASIVALDANTGKYKWHYQTTPGDVWDYDATQDLVLTDLRLKGERRKVLLQANKNGFFYVLDRASGKLISAQKFGRVSWAKGIDPVTGRPWETAGSRYPQKPVILYPGIGGGHNWQPMSYSQITRLAYIPTLQLGNILGPSPEAEKLVTANQARPLIDQGIDFRSYHDDSDPQDGTGFLVAWDPAKQELAWRAPLSSAWNGGTLTTAGNLTFIGTGAGELLAFAADTGHKLWSYDAKMAIMAAPITFALDGKQFVSVLTGYGGAGGEGNKEFNLGWKYALHVRRLLTFALDGSAALPESPARTREVSILDNPQLALDPGIAGKGEILYYEACEICHGDAVVSTGAAPDLRASGIAFDRGNFRHLLQGGALVSRGMPLFDDLSDAEVESLYQFIRATARQATIAPKQ